MKRSPPTVVILSSATTFAREITAHWPKAKDRELPEFVVIDLELCVDLQGDTFDLAIADMPAAHKYHNFKQAIAAASKPAILVGCDLPLQASPAHGSIFELSRETQSWAALAGLLGREILGRTRAESCAREAEAIRAAAEAEATLGRYMAEMRLNVNNALTSILGNAELLLQEPGLPANVQSQADTIRNMALRLHEVFRRFSSIEKELTVAARESGKKPLPSRAAASAI
jgi:signal transduction histidine kinase